MTAKGLHVHNFVLHRPSKGQIHAGGLVLELGPEDAGGIQQVQPLVHVDPLLAPGDAGAVAGLGRLLFSHLVDKGGLAHVGHPHHHSPDRTAHLALLPPFGNLVPEHPLDHGGKLIDPPAGTGVGLQHGVALAPEAGPPGPVLGGVGLIRPVEDNQAGLAGADGVNVRVAAGGRDAGVDNLHHHVHQLQVGLDLTPGLGHVAGIPLDVHRGPPEIQKFVRNLTAFL